MSILSKDRLSERLVCQQRARPENASHPGRDYVCHTFFFFFLQDKLSKDAFPGDCGWVTQFP